MSNVISAIGRFSQTQPKALAVRGAHISYSYGAFADEIHAVATRFRNSAYRRVGVLMDNAPAWAIVDLALVTNQTVSLPLPAFFSDQQLVHAIQDAGVDAVLTNAPSRLQPLLPGARVRPLPRIAGQNMWSVSIAQSAPREIPDRTAKVTYTSGTTGSPKGVCLSQSALETVAASLSHTFAATPQDRHLALMPMSVLLENVGGLYAPLLAGASSTLLPAESVGVLGATGLDPDALVATLQRYEPTTLITIPQLLRALVEMAEAGIRFASLRRVAVGGAPISAELLARATRCDLPVFEGYGLSECASVVAVNSPTQQRMGSVGKPLPHVSIAFAADGEILVRGAACQGYLGGPAATATGYWGTGDIGHQDRDGFLYITGRKKHIYITSFGRNVAPEWTERELTQHPLIAQAAVFGEGRPWAAAVVVPRDRDIDDKDLAPVIDRVNATLPDYARIGAWIVAEEPFALTNGLYTATGRPRRDRIWAHYGQRISALYTSTKGAAS